MSVPTLDAFALDDQCYKVRLLLGLLGTDCVRVAVDMLPGGEQTRPPLAELNPLGTLPILVDGTLVLREAEPILVYLARTCDPRSGWLPQAAASLASVTMWLHFAISALGPVSRARRQAIFGQDEPGDATRGAERAFRGMEDHMTRRGLQDAGWFVGDGPTLAEIALFPAIALSRDIGVDHEAYPALRRWMRRVRMLPGFVGMPGIPEHH